MNGLQYLMVLSSVDICSKFITIQMKILNMLLNISKKLWREKLDQRIGQLVILTF